MLGERGYVVTEAGDARMALAAIQQAAEPFDVVLLDYRLPDSADLRLLETVKRIAPTSQVIMITAHNSPELARAPSRWARIVSSASRSKWKALPRSSIRRRIARRR